MDSAATQSPDHANDQDEDEDEIPPWPGPPRIRSAADQETLPPRPQQPPAGEAAAVTESPGRVKKIIEFPRSLVFSEFAPPEPFYGNELAEPVLEKPGILYVPDTVSVPAPPLADVALDPNADDDAVPFTAFVLPVRVAPWSRRRTAAITDGLLVLAGAALFAAIVRQVADGVPHTKPVLALAVAIPVLFWLVYHYLFLVHAAATPGMKWAGIRLRTFEGDWAPRTLRRWRVLAMALSCVSLGFGFLWALFDEDRLCWHDKMNPHVISTARNSDADSGSTRKLEFGNKENTA